MPALPDDLRRVLEESFLLRTTLRRKDGTRRVLETTYYWDGRDEIVLSGFPGKRDWVASLAHNPEVTVHTVESSPGFDIPGKARVLRDREERLPYLFAFIERWARQPGFPPSRRAFLGVLLGAVRANQRLGLPWWGPFALARRILDAMPCVVISLSGPPRRRLYAAPAPTRPRSAAGP
jgi:hypothetical protein